MEYCNLGVRRCMSQNVLDKRHLVGDITICQVEDDPTTTPTEARAGAWLVHQSDENSPSRVFIKQSNGINTDVKELQTSV